MSSRTHAVSVPQSEFEDELENTLPPVLFMNQRPRIEPQEICISTIMVKSKEKVTHSVPTELVRPPRCKRVQKPRPLHPLSISWSPEVMCFELHREPVLHKLWVSNRSERSVYIHCCGFWDETARLGAGWRCYPRTRFRLAPGLIGEMYIKATPREDSPVPSAIIGLQLASAHLRDHVTGYFVVPIKVKFLNFSFSTIGECE